MDCLIIDDEKNLAEAISEYFNMFGLETGCAFDYDSALKMIKENEVRMIILDINLGDRSGFKLCEEIRNITDVPVMFLSARKMDDDILAALSIGGDDYMIKPCSSSVLLAKAKVILKRTSGEKKSEMLSVGKLLLNKNDMTLTVNGSSSRLPSLEYKLLLYFMENPDRVVSKDELFQKVWQDAITGDGTLNVHIFRLREKIEKNISKPEVITTVYRTGYIFNTAATELL
ncbi:DNA-binding response regulator, OmpR family, contains REC and winged-helix (wHTH) domain [Lachnospiraceae bacterium XPB1003]|nr:DNA-binding response regulator, OmpR family, contains REC and winged-helix (wHTH) domain [Lachnospiraceae bacterium XPB1003]